MFPPPTPLPARSAALGNLRRQARWSEHRLAQAARVSANTISRAEQGKPEPPEDKLFEWAGLMDYSREEIRLAVLAAERTGRPAAEPATPLDPPAWLSRRLSAAALDFALTIEPELHRDFRQAWRDHRIELDRAQAERLVARARELEPWQRVALVEGDPEGRNWALVDGLGEEAVRALRTSIDESREWIDLARRAAEAVVAPPSWRPRLRARAEAFAANTMRVGNRLTEAEAIFRQVWIAWEENPAPDLPLGEWRLLDLEASLRIDQRRFGEAIPLIEHGLTVAPPQARGRLLLNMGRTLNDMGEPARAFEALQVAREPVEDAGDARLRCTLSFHFALSLLELGRAEEAVPFAAKAHKLAADQSWRLEVLRTEWLDGKIAQALGHYGIARLAFASVRRQYTNLQLALDAALVWLDEALLLLEMGELDEVRRLAGETFWIFRSGQLQGEALAALKLFHAATRHEEVTSFLVRETIAVLRQATRRPAGEFAA
jgi:tetratricopeptide (TPR) repeat protein